MPKKKSTEVDYSSPTQERVIKSLRDLGFISLSDPDIGVKVRRCLPTGIACMDIMSARDVQGIWGLPFGRQIEIFGKPDSGKTSLALQVTAAAQRAGYITAWIELEHSLNRERASTIGVNIDDLHISTPDFLEQALTQLKRLVLEIPPHDSEYYKEDEGLVVSLDSLSAAMTRKEFEGEDDDPSQPGAWQKRMAKFMRRMRKEIGVRNVIVVYTNQVYANIGAFGFGKKTQAFGGNAPKYYCGLRFETTYTGKLKNSNGDIVGITFNLENVKNKCLAPFKKFDGLEFKFDRGFNVEQALLYAMLDRGLAKKKGSKYTIEGVESEVTMADFVKRGIAEPEFAERLRLAIDKRNSQDDQSQGSDKEC